MAHAFAINDRCIKDMRCVDACIRKAIHPAIDEPGYAQATQLHINPKRCIGCGACASACLSGAVSTPDDAFAQFSQFAQTNADWYRV